MEKSFSESYKAAGVDITAGYKSVELMKQHIKRTLTSGAMSDIGGFGGLFDLKDEMCSEPILVSGTDGVGTKLKIAMLLDKHDTIGIDCVAMCVNDVSAVVQNLFSSLITSLAEKLSRKDSINSIGRCRRLRQSRLCSHRR